ncbi:molybdopterin-dependent oxidoreductase [Hymenobacter sp. RP-2-7]|uniref:nitrate reductase (cytochrome) n=1 Tax=Hymenobacter polaris TaxID=2682546 RepID=A0A7Y0AHK4_9BACT|nr:nitrate reductase [Hymenobacter polaris]NML67503.1 molybdopterin-dependent oxidoreductase [Hymenobacter polaris]
MPTPTPKPSICCYCGVGCGVLVAPLPGGDVSVVGNPDYPVNRGALCSKGLNLQYTVNDRSDRLLHPQMRYSRTRPLQRVSWDEALQRTAAVFKTFIAKYGPDSVAFYASGQCLTEEYYVLNKLMKGFIGSNNLDTNSRLCMSSAVVGYKMALGEDSVPVCYDDLDLADCFLVAGANPAWCHPILWRRVEARKAAHPATKVIVIDPRATDTCALADLHLQLIPGTDVVLLQAIARVLLENGDVDADFLAHHTEGYETYRALVLARPVAESAALCGVPEADIRLAASYIGSAQAFLSMWTMGLNQSAVGVDKNLCLLNLHLLTGQIGRPGAGPLSLTGQPNAMGGREVGGLSNLLPAHRNLANPAHRAEVQQFWGSGPLAAQPGYTATEMFEALEAGRLKAIWIVCTNPLTSLPNARQAEAALAKAKFVVVQEVSSQPQTLTYADVVLPAAAWAEKEGTMTNSERRISHLAKVVDAPGEALPDAEIICRFAQAMGFPGFDYPSPEAIYLEHIRLTAGTSLDSTGLNYSTLKERGSVQWPYRAGQAAPDTPRLFTDHRFYTPSGRAVLHAPAASFRSEAPDEEFPFVLTTGRIRDQWHTMTKTGKVSKLTKHLPQAFLELHPQDAEALGVAEGELVTVSSRRGEVRVAARLSVGIRPGVVFLPMHWGRQLGSDLNRANNVTSGTLDPLSKEPDFKFCAVQVVKYRPARRRVVVVGAGAGACGFVKSYREVNQQDELIVFSKEDFPFYNRVLLPDYLSGHQQWAQLVKMQEAEETAYRLEVRRGVSVESIHCAEKYVLDSHGQRTDYDVLILATGSRAAVPRGVPALPGIFSMRSRLDADNFRAHLPATGAHVVVVGGGLLGLEMAASLREMGTRVTIIQRTSRFLDRQLDALGSQLLREEMANQGCELYFNDEVELFYGRARLTGVGLKSGRRLDCDAVLLAIGTVPNLELARDCGLRCQRGVVVDAHLQTSDPSVYALGEIAEFEGTLYGITAAAEQQAAVLARYLGGDVVAHYQGSTFMNIIKIHGFDLCSIGLPEAPNAIDYEEIVFIDKAQRYYKKCIIHQDRLVGAILIGDKNEFQEFRELIANRTELSDKRLQLLRSGRPAAPVLGKLVCSCNNVGAGNLRQAIATGCASLRELSAATGAGTGCGSCRPEVQRLLEESLVAVESA